MLTILGNCLCILKNSFIRGAAKNSKVKALYVFLA